MRILRSASLVGVLASLLLGAGLVLPAAADTAPTHVGIVFCDLEGGETTVPAGQVETDLAGWGVGTKGALVHWLKSQQTTVTVQYDDAAATTLDFTDLWTDPTMSEGEKFWFSFLQGPTLNLAVGETVLVTLVISWTSPTLEFFFDGEHPVLTKGDYLQSSCLITAV